MVFKSEIESAYNLQQSDVKIKKSGVKRAYLSKLLPESKHIEVISGIRRCGKSTLMKQLMQQYKTDIAYFNFEDPRVNNFEIGDFQKLDEIIGRNKAAYFFDEIQDVASWEIFVRQLHDRGEKIYITGSNASLLSKELGTRPTGRHLRHELFPFSYLEFLEYKNLKNNENSFEKYIQKGGFPEFLREENQEILQSLLKDIILRDIAVRYGIKNSKTLMDITLFLISNIGKETTYNSLRKSFSVGSANTVSDYLSWLEDTYILFFLPRFSWSAKSIAVNPRKVYAIDNGLAIANSLSFTNDKGRLLENAVYLFLRQKFNSLYYFRENSECDFVVFGKGKCLLLIQVCEQVHNENKDREVNGLLDAMRFFKFKEGYIITKSQKDTLVYDKNTIKIIPAHEFFTYELAK
ncbi:MAG TPA: ATP-binding protein [Bacteroidales bacterium]|nr:ATP-binding protein [Bacteroidales bacterium]